MNTDKHGYEKTKNRICLCYLLCVIRVHPRSSAAINVFPNAPSPHPIRSLSAGIHRPILEPSPSVGIPVARRSALLPHHPDPPHQRVLPLPRSEERRVGKEC